MSSFIHTQKLALVQPELVPVSLIRKKRIAKRYRRNAKKKCIERIFQLPLELFDFIFSNKNIGERYYSIRTITNLRLVSKTLKEAIDKFCFGQNQKSVLCFDENVPPIKFYCNMFLFNDAKLRDQVVYYNKNIECNYCKDNINGFFIKQKINESHCLNTCAFGCRMYYCLNKWCEIHGLPLLQYDLNDLKCDCRCGLFLYTKTKGEGVCPHKRPAHIDCGIYRKLSNKKTSPGCMYEKTYEFDYDFGPQYDSSDDYYSDGDW